MVRRLRESLLPKLEEVARRLEMARHGTLLDDRLDADRPSIRFRLEPSVGPFDERDAVPGSVLEIAVTEAAGELEARLWLDPLAAQPVERRTLARSSSIDPWIDSVIVDFVERTLAGGPS